MLDTQATSNDAGERRRRGVIQVHLPPVSDIPPPANGASQLDGANVRRVGTGRTRSLPFAKSSAHCPFLVLVCRPQPAQRTPRPVLTVEKTHWTSERPRARRAPFFLAAHATRQSGWTSQDCLVVIRAASVPWPQRRCGRRRAASERPRLKRCASSWRRLLKTDVLTTSLIPMTTSLRLNSDETRQRLAHDPSMVARGVRSTQLSPWPPPACAPWTSRQRY